MFELEDKQQWVVSLAYHVIFLSNRLSFHLFFAGKLFEVSFLHSALNLSQKCAIKT